MHICNARTIWFKWDKATISYEINYEVPFWREIQSTVALWWPHSWQLPVLFASTCSSSGWFMYNTIPGYDKTAFFFLPRMQFQFWLYITVLNIVWNFILDTNYAEIKKSFYKNFSWYSEMSPHADIMNSMCPGMLLMQSLAFYCSSGLWRPFLIRVSMNCRLVVTVFWVVARFVFPTCSL